jgi:hypothetical protein
MHIAVNALYRLHGGGLTHLKHLLSAWSKTEVTREHTISLFTRAERVSKKLVFAGYNQLPSRA